MTNDNLDIVLNPSELSEAASQTAVVTFGRMNPPTVGHLALVKKMLEISQQKQAKPLIFLSHSVDSKKNPLSYNDKAKLINMAFGRIVQKSNAKNIFDMLKELSGNYENLVIVVGSDRVKDLKRISTTYNGKDFNFKNIEVVSAGTRDPDSDGVTGMSATKMRDAAAKNDIQAFKRGLPNQLNKYAEKILKMVREGMNLKEDLDNIFEEHLDEAGVLTVAGRRKKAIAARRYKARLKVARRRVARRLAQTGRIKKRTARAAIRVMRNRLAGSRGKSYSKLSPQEKASIDRRVRQRGNIVKKLSTRIMPVTRRKEFARFKSFRTKKESVNLAFSSYLTENNHKEIQPISEKVLNNIIKKSIASEIPVNILSEVYDKYRGKGDSFAFNRLNEFIAKSATSDMDELFESFIAELSPETVVSFMKKRQARANEHGKLKLDATSKKEYKYHDGQQRKNSKGVSKAIFHAGNTLKRRARKAGYRVSEEAEDNIQEISKDLASRYIKRAAGSAISNADKTQYHTSKMFQKQDAGDNKGAKKEFKAGRDPSRKTMNRFYGIQRAAGKLNKNDKDKGEYLGHSMTKQKTSSKIKATEEKVQDNIQELSSKTLKNYIKKAVSPEFDHKNSVPNLASKAQEKMDKSYQKFKAGLGGKHDSGDEEDRRMVNRATGIQKAAKKLYKRTNEEKVQEGNKPGLWDNIHAKRKRIKAGSGERMRKPGSKGAPTAKNFRDAAESKDYGLSGPAYGRPRLGYTGDRVVYGQKGYKEYMAQAKKKKEAIANKQKGIKEEGGAGLMGTDALLKRYIMDTPGQTPSKDLAIDGVPGKGGVIHKQEPLKGLGQSGKQKVQSYKDYLNAKKS